MKTVAVVTGLLGGGVTISPVVQICTCQQKEECKTFIHHSEPTVENTLVIHQEKK